VAVFFEKIGKEFFLYPILSRRQLELINTDEYFFGAYTGGLVQLSHKHVGPPVFFYGGAARQWPLNNRFVQNAIFIEV